LASALFPSANAGRLSGFLEAAYQNEGVINRRAFRATGCKKETLSILMNLTIEEAKRRISIFDSGRSSLYGLIAENSIRSICLRKKGNVRGRRIVFRPSIDAYFNSLLEETK
jgi:hypothetical protein